MNLTTILRFLFSQRRQWLKGEDQEKNDEDYDDEDEYDNFEETLLESYTTAIDANHVSASTGDAGSTIDEFIVFK